MVSRCFGVMPPNAIFGPFRTLPGDLYGQFSVRLNNHERRAQGYQALKGCPMICTINQDEAQGAPLRLCCL